MKLQFLGHACFLLDDGVHKVLTDPFLTGAGRPEWAEKVDPDVIFVTHGHGDHVGDAAAIARRTGAPVCCTADLADAVFVPAGVACVAGNLGGTVRLSRTLLAGLHPALRARLYARALDALGPGQPLADGLAALEAAYARRDTGRVFQFPGGLADHLKEQVGARECVTSQFFSGSQDFPGDQQGRVEWAIAWPLWSDGAYSWYCNTIPTPDGGTHEQGLRAARVIASRRS